MRLNNQGYMPYNNMPGYPYFDRTDAQLEEMYPRIYNIVYPRVSNYCDNIDRRYGDMYIPSPNEFNNMLGELQDNIDADLKGVKEQGVDINQWIPGSNLLRDLTAILLLREISGRRRSRRGRRGRFGFYPGIYW